MMFAFIITMYVAMMIIVVIGFVRYPFEERSNTEQLPEVSVVIAARNEEAVIEQCLKSIISQNYPKHLMHIVLVNDASTDTTLQKATAILKCGDVKYTIITNEHNIGKKRSLKKAIDSTTSSFIITRDADTFTASENWMMRIASYMCATKKEFVICPVALDHHNSLLSSLQETEMAILSLFTVSSSYYKSPFLCNGANLAFTKDLFYRCGAYNDHLHIASGDDIFFLEKVKQLDRSKIGYLKNKEALVYTFPQNKPLALLHQKIRWASKLFKGTSVINWLSALIIAAANFAFIWALICALLNPQNLPLALFFILSKLLIDILLVFLASSFIELKTGLLKVALVGVIYPFYAVLVAFLSVLIKPKWK